MTQAHELPCPDCSGTGKHTVFSIPEGDFIRSKSHDCPTCQGLGIYKARTRKEKDNDV